jgi:putative phosphoesterase
VSSDIYTVVAFSDAHGNKFNLSSAMEKHKNCDAFIYLGDGVYEFDELAEGYRVPHYAVRGNGDFFCVNPTPVLDFINIGQMKIMLCHGNDLNAKYTNDDMIKTAVLHNADMVLYGHTHIAVSKYLSADEIKSIVPSSSRDKGIYIVNPGSISYPRDDRASYAVIDIVDDKASVNIVRI